MRMWKNMIQLHDIASANSPRNDSSEKDAALALVSDVAQEINPLIAKRVLRKIDLFFMPAMLIGGSPDHAEDLNQRFWLTWYRLWHGIL